MAGECYQLANSWTLWGTPHKASVKGLSHLVFPDGSSAKDAPASPGEFYTHTIWIDPNA